FVTLPLLTKNVPTTSYGDFVQVNVYVGLLTSLGLLGLDSAVVRLLPAASNRQQRASQYWSALASGGLVAALILLILWGASLVLPESVGVTPEVAGLLRAGAVTLAATIVGRIGIVVLRAERDFRWYFWLTL